MLLYFGVCVYLFFPVLLTVVLTFYYLGFCLPVKYTWRIYICSTDDTYDAEWVDCFVWGSTDLQFYLDDLQIYTKIFIYSTNSTCDDAEWVNLSKCKSTLMI